MRSVVINPTAQRQASSIGDPMDEAWVNDIYECQVRYLEERGRGGVVHLSIKRKDREASHDWRHLQAIKNDVMGWEREAIELFPAESRLVDTANQTHLWVMAAGEGVPLGYFEGRIVGDEATMRRRLRDLGASDELLLQSRKARQRPWQPGISTGPNYNPTGGRS